MKRPKISLGENELRNLKRDYNLDLSDLEALKRFQEASRETLERSRDIVRQSMREMYPHRKKQFPTGPECWFCLKTESEVYAMAKHRSGFNLCNQCIKRIQGAKVKKLFDS